MQKSGWAVAVSYLEWIRWIATGWFRCADRAVWLEGLEDQAGMDALMDRTPDLQVSDDQGFVIACLSAECPALVQRIGSARSFGHALLPVDTVEEFLPLSGRGARLLEADAERASVRLGKPVFEHLWSDWRNRRLEEEAHRRGISLCTALCLESPNLSDLPRESGDVLAGRVLAPNAEKARGSALEGTRAFGWAAALSVAMMPVREAVKESPRFSDAQAKVKMLRGDFDLRRPLLADDGMVTLAEEIDNLIRDHGGDSLPVSVMAVALHYKDISSAGRELSLGALLEDLATLAMEDPRRAALCAYFIGRSMENVAVTTLLYQSTPNRYKALSPSTCKEMLNVMRRTAEKCEIAQTRTGLPPPVTLLPDSAAANVPDATHALVDVQSVSEEAASQENSTSPGAVPEGDPAPGEKSNAETQSLDTNVAARGAGEAAVEPSAPVETSDEPKASGMMGGNALSAQTSGSVTEAPVPVAADLFPSAQIDGAASTREGSARENRKRR